MNQWIAAILLFSFKLVHVPGKEHGGPYGGPDGLSRRKAPDGDIEEREDGWVDEILGLGMWANSWRGWNGHKKDVSGALHISTFLIFSLTDTQDHLHDEMPRMK